MKSDIKMIIESLYDLGVIKRKKRRKKKVKKLLNTKSNSAPMSQNSSIPSLQETPFKNTSNLQNEYLREQLLTLENSNAQKPQFRELENQIENNRIFQNKTQRALLYLTNQSSPIIEEVGYDDEDNVDVASTGGINAVASEPVKQGFFSGLGNIFGSPNPNPNPNPQVNTPHEIKSFAGNLMDQMDEAEKEVFEKNPFQESPFKGVEQFLNRFDDDEEDVKEKGSYKDNRKELKNIYKSKGGNDPTIFGTNTKKTIQNAIKELEDLEKYQNLYENVLGGGDESLINGDITTLGKLKAEVKRKIKELNKDKNVKTATLKDLLSRH